MKQILVTGGAGYIGSHTAAELAAANFQPVIIDDFSNSEKSVIGNLNDLTGIDIPFYEGRYQDKQLLDIVFSSHKLDGVIHFAAFKAVGESVQKPLRYYDNNVAGLIVLLESMQEHSVNNLVFSSSCTV